MNSGMHTASRSVPRRHRQGPAGFTLAEALIASVVMAIVAAYALMPVLAAEQNRLAADRLKTAVQAGQAMMDEVLARPVQATGLADNGLGPAPGETSRKSFQTVDAFAGYSETAGQVLGFDQTAAPQKELSGLSRSVSVQYVTYPGQWGTDSTGLLLVKVTVLDGSSPVVQLSRVVAREQ